MTKDAASSFGEAAENYAAFRPTYPPELFEFLAEHVKSTRDAADLGAGTGQATRALATLFEHVTAVEPDMRLASEMHCPGNVESRLAAAENADFEPGSLDAVISATAFHWMDQHAICHRVANWLRPDGVFFPFAFDAFRVEGAASEFYDSEFAKWAAYRDRRLVECYDYKSTLEQSGVFANVIPYTQEIRHEFSPDVVAGIVSTFSYVRAYAQAKGEVDYYRFLSEEFARFGEKLLLSVPIIGALGVKC